MPMGSCSNKKTSMKPDCLTSPTNSSFFFLLALSMALLVDRKDEKIDVTFFFEIKNLRILKFSKRIIKDTHRQKSVGFYFKGSSLQLSSSVVYIVSGK